MKCPSCNDPINLITERHENYVFQYYRCDNWDCENRIYWLKDPELLAANETVK
jgi:hypothetical protein